MCVFSQNTTNGFRGITQTSKKLYGDIGGVFSFKSGLDSSGFGIKKRVLRFYKTAIVRIVSKNTS